MNFLLDHDVPAEIARVLSQDGHAVSTVMQVMKPTATDVEVFAYAMKHSLVLMTCNRDDFIALAKLRSHHGLIVVVRRKTRIAECAAVLRLLQWAGPAGIGENINFA